MTVSRSSDARGQRTSGRVGSRLAAFAETTQALGLKQPIRFARRSGPPLDLPPFQRSRHGRTNPSLGGLPATGGRTGALPPPRVPAQARQWETSTGAARKLPPIPRLKFSGFTRRPHRLAKRVRAGSDSSRSRSRPLRQSSAGGPQAVSQRTG